MINMLIPSDFSDQSLDCIRRLLDIFKHERMNILLVHAFSMPDSISDLMLLARKNEEYEYTSQEFRNQCKQLEQAHREQINFIRLKCFYGNTTVLFKNFLEGHRIDFIAYPEHYQFRKLCQTSLDLSQLIDKCGCEVMVVTEKMPKKDSKRLPRLPAIAYNLSLN